MKMLSISAALLFTTALQAQQTAGQTSTGTETSLIDTNIILIVLAVFLLIPISALAKAFVITARKKLEEAGRSGALKVLIPILILLTPVLLNAQAAANKANEAQGSDSRIMTIVLCCAIALEIIVLLFFSYRIADLLQVPGEEELSASTRPSLFSKIGDLFTRQTFKPIEQEAQIDLGHNYDGIRELDNVIPPWFTTAFVLCILFAGVYLYRYHVAKSAPLQIEELNISIAKADLEHEAYLAKQANNIDENNVALMSGGDLDAGKQIFTTICSACHRADGGGQVGPNLTDAYWIHGGGLHNIFKTIKYGVPAKGMISWKEQLSPGQIAQVSNYILTLANTNPPDPKAQQGELYVPEETESKDTVSTAQAVVDSLVVTK